MRVRGCAPFRYLVFVLLFCFAKYRTIALSIIETVIIVAIENKHTNGESVGKLDLYNFESIFCKFRNNQRRKLRLMSCEGLLDMGGFSGHGRLASNMLTAVCELLLVIDVHK